MEAQLNENIHVVKGKRSDDGTYLTPCPHAMAFEYINGWAYRMVGSVTCSACPFNVTHIRNTVQSGELSTKCMHRPGEEPNKNELSIINTLRH